MQILPSLPGWCPGPGSSLNLGGALIPQAAVESAGGGGVTVTGESLSPARPNDRRVRARDCQAASVSPECPAVIHGLPGRWWPMQKLRAKSALRAGHTEEPNENFCLQRRPRRQPGPTQLGKPAGFKLVAWAIHVE